MLGNQLLKLYKTNPFLKFHKQGTAYFNFSTVLNAKLMLLTITYIYCCLSFLIMLTVKLKPFSLKQTPRIAVKRCCVVANIAELLQKYFF